MRLLQEAETHLDRYRELRAASKQLISTMYNVAKDSRFDMIKAAKKLTIPVVDRTLIFDGETDTNALADFHFHEMRYGGKRIVDVLAESDTGLSPELREVLEAHRAARCSLFEIMDVVPEFCQIRLRDLFGAREDVALTDISLSKCAASRTGDLLFTRLVRCWDVNMSVGLFFAFDSAYRVGLLKAYENRMRTVGKDERAQRTYIFFYQQNREIGFDQRYEDVA